ncbi:dCTP deaminase domain-containing protein [Propioniciclava flava]
MLLSDREITAHLDAARIRLDPYDPGLVQPASVDVRMDRYFLPCSTTTSILFIDPAQEQPELTRLVEVGRAGTLHPASRQRRVRLGDRPWNR